MKTACLTVFYPGMESFATDFLNSVAFQSKRNFDLVVVNDGSQIKKETVEAQSGKSVLWYECNESPQKNRIFGLQKCEEQGYERVVCADADETMDARRIEEVETFMNRHSQAPVVFNNSVASAGGKQFDLFYKERITWRDLLDFNMLGYGAMNLQGKGISFFTGLENPRVKAFDWYAGFLMTVFWGAVPFLKTAFNHYRSHADNFVGPVFNVSEAGVRQALEIKGNLYHELYRQMKENGLDEIAAALDQKRVRYSVTMDYIQKHSFQNYFKLVQNEFKHAEKLFWWQEGLLL